MLLLLETTTEIYSNIDVKPKFGDIFTLGMTVKSEIINETNVGFPEISKLSSFKIFGPPTID